MKFNPLVLVTALAVSATGAHAQSTIGTTIDISTYWFNGPNSTFSDAGFAGSGGDGEIARDYLQFSLVPGLVFSSAILNLFYFDQYNNAVDPLSIYETSNDFSLGTSWNEKPALGTVIATFNPQTPGWYSFDVTSYANSASLAGGTVSFAIAGTTEYEASGTPSSWRYFIGGQETLTLTEASAPAPEPASWALMLGGFGMIGGALRSRKKMAVSFG